MNSFQEDPSSQQCTWKSVVQEKLMSADYSGTVPKRGGHVGIAEQTGQFEVVDVNTLMQTANLKSTDGKEHVTRNIPWTSLKFQETK
jgi:hypothetical protein